MSNYKEVCTVPTDFGVTFTKLKSDKTGLTVMLADIEGKESHDAEWALMRIDIAPLVNGYFALATESKQNATPWRTNPSLTTSPVGFDDFGCPHTLEQ